MSQCFGDRQLVATLVSGKCNCGGKTEVGIGATFDLDAIVDQGLLYRPHGITSVTRLWQCLWCQAGNSDETQEASGALVNNASGAKTHCLLQVAQRGPSASREFTVDPTFQSEPAHDHCLLQAHNIAVAFAELGVTVLGDAAGDGS